MKNLITRLLSVALMAMSINTALAEDDFDYAELSLEELLEVRIVTIATGTAQKITEAAAVTTVITANDIEAMGATDLDDVLESVPGLHVARNSVTYSPIYTIRGIYSEYNPEVLVLVNGLPINTIQTGNRGPVWGGMPIKSISRIEVIRGPGSAVYGADAFSGVINIITKRKDDIDGTEAGVRAGSFNTKDVWVLHGKQYGDVDVAVMLEYHDTDGHDSTVQEDAQTQFDHAFGTNASLASGPVSMSRQNVDARLDLGYKDWNFKAGFQGRYDVGTGTGLAQALDSVGRYSSERINADLNYHNDTSVENWVFDAQLAFLDMNYKPENDQRLFPSGVSFGGEAYLDGYIGNPGVSERHTRLNLSAIYKGFKNHSVRLGSGYHYADMYKITHEANYGINPYTGTPLTTTNVIVDLTDTPYAFLPEKNRNSQYAFIQDTWDISEQWQLTTGLRYDHYSDFGNTLNPRIALVWKPSEDWTAKLLYGRAFRAPSFLELYAINNPVNSGNPNLKPEKNETYEFAVAYKASDDFQLGVNLFYYLAEDAVDFVLNPTSDKIIAQNERRQKGTGGELELQQKLSDKLLLVANYAYQDVKDRKNNASMGNAPNHQAYLRLDWFPMNKLHLDTQINWVGNRKRIYNDTRDELDGYTTVDLLVDYKVNNNWKLAFSVRNLFDADRFEPSLGPDTSGIVSIPYDLPLASRTYYLETSHRF